MDEIDNNFPYHFDSLSRSVSSSSSNGGIEETAQPQEGAGVHSKAPQNLNEIYDMHAINNNFGTMRATCMSPVVNMAARSDSKQSFSEIENLCQHLGVDTTDRKSTSTPIHVVTTISSFPPGITRTASYGSEFKPAFLYTSQDESNLQELIGVGLSFDEYNTDVGLNIESPSVAPTISSSSINAWKVAEPKITDIAPPQDILQQNSELHKPVAPTSVNKARTQSQATIKSSTYPQPQSKSPYSKSWHPDGEDVELFECVINILKSYTLGVKEIIGLRQILRNKFGDPYVNRFNKKLSSKSLLWRYMDNENRLKDVVKQRAKKFTLVVKNETSMFYLSITDHIPEGFSRWAPRSDPNFLLNDISRRVNNKKDPRAAEGPNFIEEGDITLLAQPTWSRRK